MPHLSYPFSYLALRNGRGWLLLIRDIAPVFFISMVLSLPFMIFDHSNYVHKDGFLDKLGSFSSVLTGFYVAGLVAVATFSHNLGDLDDVITMGPIVRAGENKNEDVYLTRREYVCQMFGYLATLSLLITLTSIVSVIVAQGYAFSPRLDIIVQKDITYHIPLREIVILLFSLPVSHLVVTTTYGLYYLIDKIYDKRPVIKSKPTVTNSSDEMK